MERRQHLDLLERLTPRECEVAERVVAGASNGQTALALGLSRRTVENHLANIYRKLRITSREQLAAAAIASLQMDEAAPIAPPIDAEPGRDWRATAVLFRRPQAVETHV